MYPKAICEYQPRYLVIVFYECQKQGKKGLCNILYIKLNPGLCVCVCVCPE
jgi:hypothetical protein